MNQRTSEGVIARQATRRNEPTDKWRCPCRLL